MSLHSCKCPKCFSENIRFDYKYNTILNGVFVGHVVRHFQKQKTLSWKKLKHLSVQFVRF